MTHGVLRDQLWTPLREHLQKMQFTSADAWEAESTWRMPVRVAAAPVSGTDTPPLTDNSDVENSPSDAPASSDDADAEEDVEMSADRQAEIEKTVSGSSERRARWPVA